MMIYYSKSQKSFYDSRVSHTLPSDAVEISAEEHQSLLDQQATGMMIDFTGDEPEAITVIIPLSVVKENKRQEINQAREKANQTYFTHMGKDFVCDPLSKGDIIGVNGQVCLTGALPVSLTAWKAMDNTYLPLPDLNAWKAFYGAMVNQGFANFQKSQELKALVDAAESVEEVNLIHW